MGAGGENGENGDTSIWNKRGEWRSVSASQMALEEDDGDIWLGFYNNGLDNHDS